MRFASSVVVALLTLLVNSNALAQDDGANEGVKPEDVCVYTRRIDNFDGLDDEHLFVEERGNENYLFTMRNRCFGLGFANGVGIKGTASRVCGDGFGEVLYRDAGGRIVSCGIDSIEVVESKEHAKDLVDERSVNDE